MKEAPKYVVVAGQLRQEILEGQYGVNDQLPRENAIAKAYNVSRITVRKALDGLVEEGLIYRIQGSGTYVKDNHPSENTTQKSTLEIFDFDQYKIDLLNFAVVKPEKSISNQLNVTQFDFTYEVERLILRREDDVIVGLQKIYMPAKVIQGMRMEVLKGSIYEFLEGDLGLELDSAIRTLSSEMASTLLVEKLKLEKPEPLLTMEQRSFLKSRQIFEYAYTYIRPSEFSLHETINLKS
ncbi:GntR family transcriptional regulator [Lactiplantibacillus pentosus]|uniref:GntR family transcriptional regulator n=1 Tax=Lactiplantibacillus pentosus TaxID=1589 RepID=UPI001F2EB9D6|nr:GntR family transcriptional regulator [Lactiplantibacillus pentosus]MCE6032127.1 GntR family transcriptional regulator [Lactiplantibacillus pentosus]